ncbi:hypothetical protein H5410_025178 [Solanum commersonii]|uniref:F-box domain-containing protein n=1 Tax=Solanum commersonii TaxID=4109 RepID=A0A9J5YXS7_SOLCO|nr:hypothetical protein H5410_025178 [Solanum commersonii]
MVVLRADHPKVSRFLLCNIYDMMLPNDKKLCSATLPSDVLSNLPENVLDDILRNYSNLPPFGTSCRTNYKVYHWKLL